MENPLSDQDEFMVNDKVMCVDDSPDYGLFGELPNSRLKKGALYTVFAVHQYNVRGEVLHVFNETMKSGWEKHHFKLVQRD